MTDIEDIRLAEDAVENALQILRSTDKISPYTRDKYRKVLKNELKFLQEHCPESYIHTLEIDVEYRGESA